MKRLICILCVLLLCSVALAEETAVISKKVVCGHNFKVEAAIRDEHLWCIGASDADPALFVSAECTLCGAQGIVYDDEELLEPNPCEPEECTHRLLRLSSNTYSTWTNESGSRLVQKKYGAAQCIDCGTFGTLTDEVISVSFEEIETMYECEHEYIVYEQTKPEFERYESCGGSSHACFKYYQGICRHCGTIEWVVFVGAFERHTWTYSGKDQHIDGENRHEIIYECSVCDAQTTETRPCPGPESGACDILIP